MLFAKIGKDLIYVKPENHGLYIKDGLLGHIAEYTTAQMRKETLFGSLARSLLSFFGYDIGSDQSPTSQKERIPNPYLTQFAQALKQADDLEANEKKELIQKSKQDGIQTLEDSRVAQSTAPQLRELVQQYRQEYNNDLRNRFGNEINIKYDNLLTHAGMQQ